MNMRFLWFRISSKSSRQNCGQNILSILVIMLKISFSKVGRRAWRFVNRFERNNNGLWRSWMYGRCIGSSLIRLILLPRWVSKTCTETRKVCCGRDGPSKSYCATLHRVYKTHSFSAHYNRYELKRCDSRPAWFSSWLSGELVPERLGVAVWWLRSLVYLCVTTALLLWTTTVPLRQWERKWFRDQKCNVHQIWRHLPINDPDST